MLNAQARNDCSTMENYWRRHHGLRVYEENAGDNDVEEDDDDDDDDDDGELVMTFTNQEEDSDDDDDDGSRMLTMAPSIAKKRQTLLSALPDLPPVQEGPFAKLPFELLTRVFQMMPVSTIMGKASLVCKTWANAVRTL